MSAIQKSNRSIIALPFVEKPLYRYFFLFCGVAIVAVMAAKNHKHYQQLVAECLALDGLRVSDDIIPALGNCLLECFCVFEKKPLAAHADYRLEIAYILAEAMSTQNQFLIERMVIEHPDSIDSWKEDLLHTLHVNQYAGAEAITLIAHKRDWHVQVHR
jgi:hypothetical protein